MSFLFQLNKIQRITALSLCLYASALQAQTVEQFLDQPLPAKAYLNCVDQQKIATQECLVTLETVTASTPRTKDFFGEGNQHDLLKIHWPNGDVSQYVPIDSFELWNLSDDVTYHYRTKSNKRQLDLSHGLMIETPKTNKQHTRLW